MVSFYYEDEHGNVQKKKVKRSEMKKKNLDFDKNHPIIVKEHNHFVKSKRVIH
jgi:hypothetical protein